MSLEDLRARFLAHIEVFLKESFWPSKELTRKIIEIMIFIICLFCFSLLQYCKLPTRLWLYVNLIFVSIWFVFHPNMRRSFRQDSFSSIGPLSGPHNRALSSKLRLPFLYKIWISVWEYVFPSKICLSKQIMYFLLKHHLSEYVHHVRFSSSKYAVINGVDLNSPLDSSLWNLIDSSGVMF